MVRMDMLNARNELGSCHIYRDSNGLYPDFHALRSEVVDGLLVCATERGYRKPKNANGSRARCFYEYLVRTAK